MKFRVWDVKSGVMVNDDTYDDYYIRGDGALFKDAGYDLGCIEKCSTKDYIVMLSTGVNDANGVEVYEGDVVELVGDLYVILHDNVEGFSIKSPMPHGFKVGTSALVDVVVIGNIYENPGLLEGDK